VYSILPKQGVVTYLCLNYKKEKKEKEATLEILNSIIKLTYHTSTMSLMPSLKYDIATSNRIVSTLFQPILLNKVCEIILSVVSYQPG